jgi:hypothetical protein
MNAPRVVSAEYVQGITDARALWRIFERDGIADLQHAREALANVEQCLGMGFGREVRDSLKGERDFFRQRVKLLAETRAREGVAA